MCSGAVCEYTRLCALRSLIYSTAGWQSNKRTSMGDLTSTNIPIIILLKHPICVYNPSGPQGYSGPTAHKNPSRSAHRKKAKARWPETTQKTWKRGFMLFSPALFVTVPKSNYFAILRFYMTDVSLHHASASSVLKHISVCLTKHSSCDTRADFFLTHTVCLNFCRLHVSTWGSLNTKSLQLGLEFSVLLSVSPSFALFSLNASSLGFNNFY